MPELPEVETVRRQLEAEILGAEIGLIEVREEKIFVGQQSQVVGEVIFKIERVGKYLFVFFASGRGLVVHLKMTGRLIIKPLNHLNITPLELDYETAPHTRVVINLSDGRKIYYWDTRKFGYIHALDNVQMAKANLEQKMGPEPWKISDTDLLRKLQKTGRPIKEAILDQSMLAGVGNIYANDGLWLAGIDPRRKANTLKLSEVEKLRASLITVLERGLATGGASDNTYRDFYGGKGGYQNEFLVYGRSGEPCNKCGRELKRIVVGGRGSWVCEECQK
ncbi:MAG: bifunctional DNA-formamidopyrimidine glycosylase/DNA-(apurinic or apyrimidinic site) lyase [Microgenomates group bacterium]